MLRISGDSFHPFNPDTSLKFIRKNRVREVKSNYDNVIMMTRVIAVDRK